MMVVHERGVLSGMVREVLDADAGIEVQGELLEESDVADAVERADPDVVVWLAQDPRRMKDVFKALLLRCPRVRVLALEDGRKAFLWHMHPRRRKVGHLSLEKLLREVRGDT
jgi:chemotaxis response regulator CheB